MSFTKDFTETSTLNTRETRFPANVAQLVEQLTRNEQVAGSSPAVGSLLFDRGQSVFPVFYEDGYLLREARYSH